MAEELGERTEQPTARKRRDARDRGQVAKSTDFAAAIDLAAGLIVIVAFGSWFVEKSVGVVRGLLDPGAWWAEGAGAASTADIGSVLARAATQGMLLAGPALLLMMMVGIAGQVVQVGWHPTGQPLTPNPGKLNPLSGMGKVVGKKNLIKTGLGMVKLALVLTVAGLVAAGQWQALPALAGMALGPGLEVLSDLIVDVCVWTLAVILLIGLADWMLQRWHLTQELRMTKQEVKEERRLFEGDMLMKGRRLRMAREIAMQRVRQAVPTADVVVANPTHFAVALKYESGRDAAPVVVAKGADWMALRIREVAAAWGVTIVEKPELARALYATARVGKSIRPEFYEAVAEVLAYVYRLKRRAA